MHPIIVVAYNATEEAADGLALGRLLAELQGAELRVAPVLANTPSSEVTDRNAQRRFREELAATHAEAAQLLGDDAFELWPVFGEPVPTGIQALAADRGAGLIVFGSPQHGPIGRVLLGSSAEEAVHGAPCAIAVAPHGFRTHARIEPRVVGRRAGAHRTRRCHRVHRPHAALEGADHDSSRQVLADDRRPLRQEGARVE